MTTKFKFSKMQGLGNDFVVINVTRQKILTSTALIQKIANRHYGIGCDQVLIIGHTTTPGADFSYTIFNSDGSQAGQCGNGARCVARFVHEHGLSDKKHLVFALQSHNIHVEINDYQHIAVNMGIPQFSPSAIPMHLTPQAPTYTVVLDGTTLTFSAVSMGNPHCVISVNAPLETFPLAQWGEALNHHPLFPDGVNVSVMHVDSRKQLSLRVFERGAGETLACGSAACAAMVCAYQLGLVDSSVIVRLPGGELSVAWEGDHHPVWMTGPAEQVFEGEWDL